MLFFFWGWGFDSESSGVFFFLAEKKRPEAGILNIYDVDARFFLLLLASFSKLAGRCIFFVLSHTFFPKNILLQIVYILDLHGICSIQYAYILIFDITIPYTPILHPHLFHPIKSTNMMSSHLTRPDSKDG